MRLRIPVILLVALCGSSVSRAQELYVFSEPASNVPSRSVSARLSGHYVSANDRFGRPSGRVMVQTMLGLSRKFMVSGGLTFADMHTSGFRYESFNLYAKYRFLSSDGLHRHFRMAAYAEASSTRAPFHYDEITLMGDKGGLEAGLIATQLWHKMALSATLSHTQVLDASRNNGVIYVPERNYRSVNYSLSAGYLLFPRAYRDYKQTNLNLYLELLAQHTLDRPARYADLAPALQFIFSSNTKLNLGYRFQVAGSMDRMTNNSWLLTVERTFLNALGRNRN